MIMSEARVRILLLLANLGVAAAIASLFIWGLRGAHRFPAEAAANVAVLLVLLLWNAAYLWWQRRSSSH